MQSLTAIFTLTSQNVSSLTGLITVKLIHKLLWVLPCKVRIIPSKVTIGSSFLEDGPPQS